LSREIKEDRHHEYGKLNFFKTSVSLGLHPSYDESGIRDWKVKELKVQHSFSLFNLHLLRTIITLTIIYQQIALKASNTSEFVSMSVESVVSDSTAS
jgi:hypothetical protein